jgi:hypothetical protein
MTVANTLAYYDTTSIMNIKKVYSTCPRYVILRPHIYDTNVNLTVGTELVEF